MSCVLPGPCSPCASLLPPPSTGRAVMRATEEADLVGDRPEKNSEDVRAGQGQSTRRIPHGRFTRDHRHPVGSWNQPQTHQGVAFYSVPEPVGFHSPLRPAVSLLLSLPQPQQAPSTFLQPEGLAPGTSLRSPTLDQSRLPILSERP